jgi:trimethylamine--corrinoid protein Co-methyltransferase
MGGANLNHDVGYLDFGRTGSLEMVVIMDEVIDQMRRLLRGVPVNDETLGLDVIDRVGPGGHFLTDDHTLRHLRTTQWRPTLINREGYESWRAGGGLSLRERARKKLFEIMHNHRPSPLPSTTVKGIESRVEQFHQ